MNHVSISYQRQSLPITNLRTQILWALEKYTTLVLVGETGSGKTTQVTQFLNEAKWTARGRCVVCTQSRRISAISVAKRVAEEMGCELGGLVGYAIRFESKVSPSTVIKYMTDGSLLRETMSDPLLSAYSVVIVDEAHERSLYSDILLGLLKKIKAKRKDLRVIVMSATVNAETFREFFETNLKDKEDASKNTGLSYTHIHSLFLFLLLLLCLCFSLSLSFPFSISPSFSLSTQPP
jgi:ATP-dependent RNA helicase DDX35